MHKLFKIVTLLILTSALVGCQIDSANLKQYFKDAIEASASSEMTRVSNHTATYFDYYLPITMGRINSTETSVILESQDTEILLTLDIINIVLRNSLDHISELRPIFSDSATLISIDGKMLDSRGYDQYYKAQVFDLENTEYLIVIQTQSAVVSAKTKIGLVPDLAYEMLRIARSVSIDRSLILANYSNTETINYQKVNLNMFSQMAPESGTILDMIEGEESNLLDDDYYNMINDSPTEEEILQD